MAEEPQTDEPAPPVAGETGGAFPGANPEDAWPSYCDPDYVLPETIEVAVRGGPDGDVVLSVDIERCGARKPYLGGFRHKKNGKTFHHASCQSAERGLLPPRRDVEGLRHRDTQTYETKTRSCQSTREYGTQMARNDVLAPRGYFSDEIAATTPRPGTWVYSVETSRDVDRPLTKRGGAAAGDAGIVRGDKSRGPL